VRARLGRALDGIQASGDLLELYRILAEPGFLEDARSEQSTASTSRQRFGDALVRGWRTGDSQSVPTATGTMSERGSRNHRSRWWAAGLLVVAGAVWIAADRHVNRAFLRVAAEAPTQAEPEAGVQP